MNTGYTTNTRSAYGVHFPDGYAHAVGIEYGYADTRYNTRDRTFDLTYEHIFKRLR